MNISPSNINPSVSQADQLPDSAHLRPKACAQLMGVSISTFWRLAKAKAFPVHKLTQRTASVRAGDLRAFMAGKEGA
jgi:predicted DNA-binding transcriptional regulator AlpA